MLLLVQASPLPRSYFWNVFTVVPDVGVVLRQQAVHLIDEGSTLVLQGWDLFNRILGQVETVKVVQDPHVKWRGNVTIFFIAVD